MVLPDGAAPSEPERPPAGRRALFVGAAVALLIGALTLGALTTPDPQAVEPSTTTSTTHAVERPIDLEDFSVAQIAVGEPLDWSMVAELEGAWPAQLVSHEGWLFLFTSAEARRSQQPIGNHVYFSADGSDWSDLGAAIPTDGWISAAASTPFGLVALDANASDGAASVWRSTDGVTWARSVLAESGNTHYAVSGRQSIGSTDSLVIVAAVPYADGTTLLRDRLRGYRLDIDLDNVDWEVIPNGDSTVVQLRGPFGIPAMQIPVSELSLTLEERDILQGRYQEQDVVTWATTDGVNWTPSTVEGVQWVQSIAPSNDGSLVLFGARNAGNLAWSTYDGVTWERAPNNSRAARVEPWHDGLVGLPDSGLVDPLFSADGEEWTRMGLSDHFPVGVQWYPAAFAAHDAGIAVWVAGYGVGPFDQTQITDPAVLERDDARLSIDFQSGVFTLDHADIKQTWQMWTDQSQENLAIDLVTRTFTFLDAGGTPITTFTFDELWDAENQYWAEYTDFNQPVNALAFTSDGENWSIQDLDGALGGRRQVMDLHLTNDSVIAVVSSSPDPYLGSGEFQIWTAPIP